jgi:DNA mismatch repair protein MSH6
VNQSTFFVELAETAAALREASRRSLVIMDELGRGTSTFDGTAIASATVQHLVERNKCLTLFATHYHSLLDEWSENVNVKLGHMECLVENKVSDSAFDDCDITFLYTLGSGACPSSFGINVARLAGIPEDVLIKAKQISADFEIEMSSTEQCQSIVQQEKGIIKSINTGDWIALKRLWESLN